MATAAEHLALLDQILQDPSLTSDEKIARAKNLRLPASTKHVTTSAPAQVNGTDLTPEQKLTLITSNLQECLNKEIMEDVLFKEKRPLQIYWGTAPTGRPHCGYFVPMIKIAQFLQAGCSVKILLADIHAFLDNLKAPINLVKYRAGYYKHVIIALMTALNVPIGKLDFVLGSSYQLTPEYQMDLLRACTIVSMHDARKAGAEVVKQVEDATLSGLIYPLMQALDEQYLEVDAQFGGVDQRKIFTLAKDLLPKLEYKERAHLMNPMVPGLAGGKMSASDPNSKIDVLEKPEAVKKKLSKAHCAPKQVEGNGVLSLVQYTLLPASALKLGKPRFVVERHEGEPLVYESIEQMHKDYAEDILTPQLLKASVTVALNELLAPIQAAFEESKSWQELNELAYPSEEVKKVKKIKNKGTKHPGAASPSTSTAGSSTPQVSAQPDGSVEGNDKAQVDLATSGAEAMKELKLEKDIVNGSLVVGDVNGSFREVFKKISTLHAKNAFAFAIVAGSLFDSTGAIGEDDLDDLLAGRIEVPLSTYFALGASPLPAKVVEKLDANNGEVCENLLFLGRRTTVKTSEGVRIVALGGTFDSELTAEASKDRYLARYSGGDAKTLRGANTADILVTTDWPNGIMKGSKSRPTDAPSSTTSEQETIADLCSTLKPRYHFSTNSSAFFEREPFFHAPVEDATADPGFQITRFISLAPYGNPSKAKWIYAFSLDPTSVAPVTLPPGTTVSPLPPLLSKKRPLQSSSQAEAFSRYAQSSGTTSHHQHPSKRRRQPPPTPDSCFFCLSNPTVETHLVTSIGDDAYMTVAKGPLTTTETFARESLDAPGHMLIIPLPHVATLAGISDAASRTATAKEMRRFRTVSQEMLQKRAEGKLGSVVWEVSRSTGVHTHWQMMPVATELVEKGLVEAAFRVEAENENFPSFDKTLVLQDGDDAREEDERADVFRVWIWSPGENAAQQTLLTLPLSSDFRFDLNFGRRVMAKLLGLEKRLNWRDCTQSVSEETADADAWKGLFKEFDFSL